MNAALMKLLHEIPYDLFAWQLFLNEYESQLSDNDWGAILDCLFSIYTPAALFLCLGHVDRIRDSLKDKVAPNDIEEALRDTIPTTKGEDV